tara:strand:+ start:4620 stop:4964 length:345 start_codon:yes stop_codon:yes gene_type:complete
MNRIRVNRVEESPENPREGYSYRRLVEHGEGVPFNFLTVSVQERHKTRRVIDGIRNYFVVSGSGHFVVEDEEIEVRAGTLITIWPDETYSYQGEMELIEFNVAIDGKIGHEDIE